MAKHKWYNEIVAWAETGEIDWRLNSNDDWQTLNFPAWYEDDGEYRIKPQPKEPQYLYAWSTEIGIALTEPKDKVLSGYEYIGKIKLESNDD